MLHSWAIPYLQLGRVPYKTFDFLSCSPKSFSSARHYIIDGLAHPLQIGQVPLWHSAAFKNDKRLTYYSTKLVSMKVLTVADLYDSSLNPHANLMCHIRLTWQMLYQRAPRNLLKVPITDWLLPSVWIVGQVSDAQTPRCQSIH